MRNVSEGGDGKFGQDPEGVTTNVACEVETTKPGYLEFEPGGMSTINWRPTGGQVSEYIRSHRDEPISEPSQKPNGSSNIPNPEES